MSVERASITIALLCLAAAAQAQISSPEDYLQRILLVGNLADSESPEELATALDSWLFADSLISDVLFLGDQIGQLAGDAQQTQLHRALTTVLKVSTRHPDIDFTFMPGDRDWCGTEGWDCVRYQEDVVRKLDKSGPGNLRWLPDDGCPGPETVELGEKFALIAVNTTFFGFQGRKPRASDALCPYLNFEVFFEELEEVIEEQDADRIVLLAGHHPPFGHGWKGGRATAAWHLIPGVGSVIAGHRQTVGTKTSIRSEQNQHYIDELGDMLEHTEPVIHLSAQDQGHEIFEQNGQVYVGVGIPQGKTASPADRRDAFRSKHGGVVQLAISASGAVDYEFLLLEGDSLVPETSVPIYRSRCGGVSENAALAPNPLPCVADFFLLGSQERDKRVSGPSHTAAAGPQYDAGFFRRVLFGRHFRQTWTAPVTLPVLDLDTVADGLTVIKRGGGRQTLSLKFRSSDGYDYVFRSVDKDPSKALSYDYRNTVIAIIAQDQTTTQHPYGAVPTARLLDHLGILHATPKPYFLPDDLRLGNFQETFGGMMGLLEEKPGNYGDNPGQMGADRIFNSHAMFSELYQGNGRIALEEYLRARMFDIWVGDWGKHEDNWKWAGIEEERNGLSRWYFRPIPRDRDHVFSQWDGLFPWLADREWAKPSGEHFDGDLKDIRSLTWQVRHMDRFLTAGSDQGDWRFAARQIQSALDSAEIAEAIDMLPGEVHDISGQKVEEALLARLADLEEYAVDYYRLLAREIDVVGTVGKDHFVVQAVSDEEVDIARYDRFGQTAYRRLVKVQETEEVRLFGLGEDDLFSFYGEMPAQIRWRVIGGDGKDSLEGNATGRVLFYDKGDVSPQQFVRQVDHAPYDAYSWNRTAFTYSTYLPMALISYGAFSGFRLDAGVDFLNQRYGKTDFSTLHSLRLGGSSVGHYRLEYRLTFHEVVGKFDLMLQARSSTGYDDVFFFGLGNNSDRADSLSSSDFRTFLNINRALISLQRNFWDNASVTFDLAADRYSTRGDTTLFEARNRLLNEEFRSRYYARTNIDLDTRDSKRFPRRGNRMMLSAEAGRTASDWYGLISGSMTWHATARFYPVTLSMKAGGAMSWGSLDWFQFPALGQTSGLRGFRAQRFRDNHMLYSNLELRLPVGKIRGGVLPMTYGLTGFFDSGRVFHGKAGPLFTEDQFNVGGSWHMGYGGGFWIAPLTEAFTLSLQVAFSGEETGLFLFGFGTAL